ncbi:MAG: Holliday junction branch migration protein RuvA [Lentisphaerae bacterium]|nr:Holliday junction branch migration protein RuvA [Lentisphaerota bacterium]MCP4102149.1 Holliday junction branch migration protein RuvA [Lentisphaerota bacterium]
MIARLTGTLIEPNFTACIIDVHGVGYQVFIPVSTFDKLPREGEQVSLIIHTQVREDSITLYGFATGDEKRLFELLISVSGVGAKLTLSILSSMTVTNFCNAICSSDLNVIKKISGIGKRTAERLIVELKDKVAKFAPVISSDSVPDEKANAAEDAILALEQLGFKRDSVSKVMDKIINATPLEESSSENFIRKALQALNS